MESQSRHFPVLLTSFSLVFGVSLLLCGSVTSAAPAITISPQVPADIPGGAPQASLSLAAAFAWQEFIALNWPAQSGQRDQPDQSRPFGAQGGPLVWETFRSKVETFPGNGSAEVGPPGYNPTVPDFGYNTPPTYIYGVSVPACAGQAPPRQPAWINLDETTQIGLNQMFAGVSPNTPSANGNSNPQLVRFLAKANQTQFRYVAANQYWYGDSTASPPPVATAPVTKAALNFKLAVTQIPAVYPSGPIVKFPAGTIEIKAAWRKLGPTEDASRFHQQTVRFYEAKGPSGNACYLEETWALVALHIIQKTPTADAFIFATFEQADNILLVNGTPVEDADGVIVNRPTAAAPTTPGLVYTDQAAPSLPQIQKQGPFCTNGGKQLYFQETVPGINDAPPAVPFGGSICVNERYESITPDVIAVNQAAHAAIASYTQAQGVKGSPWQHYKLVSVQAKPFDISQISNTDSSHGPGVFFQANIMVETDFTLQQFRGRVALTPQSSGSAFANGPPTSYLAEGLPPPNVYSLNPTARQVTGVNMGGCMGCHGNGQVHGYDFSFILQGGAVTAPDTPSPASVAAASLRYTKLFNPHLSAN